LSNYVGKFIGKSPSDVVTISKEETGEHLFTPSLGSPGSKLVYVKEASNATQHTFRAQPFAGSQNSCMLN